MTTGPFDGPFMGHFPARPDHPDFWKLSDVVLQHDGLTEEPSFDMRSHIATVLDPESLLYLVDQRVRRQLERSPHGPLITAQALWLDAFMVGVAFAQQHPKETP